jgi:hypothetical protein
MKSIPHRDTNLYFDKVIIGSTVQAMVTAYKYQIPIFVDKTYKPIPHYHLSSELDLSQIQVENKITEFELLSGKKEFRGMQRLELWNIMAYRLGAMGLMPLQGAFTNTFSESIPVGQNIRMFSVHSDNKVINVNSKKTILFDFPKHTLGRKTYMVNDYIDLDKIYDFSTSLFPSKDCDFEDTIAFETIFYKGKGRKHKVCAKSIVSQENIDSWKYSPTAVRLRVQNSIFWNLEKKFELILGKREISPIMRRMSESIEDIIEFDVLDEEFYE